MILIAALLACVVPQDRCPGPDRSPFAGNCVGSDYADTDECQRFLRRAAKIERLLIRIGFAPYDAWYASIYYTPAERRRETRALLCRGPVSVIADDDPGLADYADVAAKYGLEEAKIELAFQRGESCGPDDRHAPSCD